MNIRYLHPSIPALRRRLFAGALAACVLAGGAYADQHWEGLHGEVRQGEAVSLEQLLDWLEARYRGEVIEIEMERDDDEIEYEIKMLGPQGQVVEFEFDARTGQLMKIEGARINEMMRVR